MLTLVSILSLGVRLRVVSILSLVLPLLLVLLVLVLGVLLVLLVLLLLVALVLPLVTSFVLRSCSFVRVCPGAFHCI